MLYLLQDPSTGEYALFNEESKQYSWWCILLEKCWISYNKCECLPADTTLESIINSRSIYHNTKVVIVDTYTLESHPELFI